MPRRSGMRGVSPGTGYKVITERCTCMIYDAAVGLRAPADAQIAAEPLPAHVLHRERGFGEAHASQRTLYRRQARVHGDGIAGEVELACDLVLFHLAQRQLEAQVQPAAAERT